MLLFFFLSVPAALSCSPVLAVRPFCSGVSSGCHSGPRAFFGFSRDCSEALFWTRGGRGVCSFFVCCFSRFAAHTFLVGLAPGLRKAGPRVVSPAPLARVRARGRMPFSGGGTQTPSCLFYFVLLVFVLGHRDPRALLFAGAPLLAPGGSHTHGFFPRFFSLSLISLSLICIYIDISICWPSGPRMESKMNKHTSTDEC